MIDRETIKRLAAESGMAFGDPIPTSYEQHVDRWEKLITKAIELERARLFAIVADDPSAIWRDEGFRQWHLKRLPSSEESGHG